MLVDIKTTEQLEILQSRTGRTIESLVDEILGIYLDENRKREFIGNELDNLFELYKKKHNVQD